MGKLSGSAPGRSFGRARKAPAAAERGGQDVGFAPETWRARFPLDPAQAP